MAPHWYFFSKPSTVLDFRPKANRRRVPNYLGRRKQLRLLVLVLAVGLVMMFMSEARNPQGWPGWQRMWGAAAPAEGEAGGRAIDTRLEPARLAEDGAAAFVAQAPPRFHKRPRKRLFPGVQPDLLASVRDDTVFRSSEADAFYHLFDILAKTDERDLVEASAGLVTFTQLLTQPDEYRGELVTIRGTVHRAFKLRAAPNEYDVSGYYQTWVQPDNGADPIVVYCLELPDGFPTGMKVGQQAELTGFFFKRWAYKAQDAIRTAPLLLARTLTWQGGAAGGQRPAVAGGRAQPRAAARGSREAARVGAAPPIEKHAKKSALSGPRRWLGLYGVDESHWRSFVDGRPVGAEENEALLRVLYAVRRFDLADIERWKLPETAWARLAAAAEEHRGDILPLAGRVTQVAVEKLLPEVAERFDMEQYYRCEFLIGKEATPATVYALAVPKAWKTGQPLDERASVQGFFLKLAGAPPEPLRPVFVAQRAAWHPRSVLGGLEMDAGLFDQVQNRSSMSDHDRECFYQLLAAAGRAGTGELLRRTEGEFSVEPLFNQPDSQHGRLVALTGTARRAMLVRVDDADVASRFGIDHYYQIELFTGDSQGNPLVFCVRKLPRGFPTGEDIFETVRVPGFFFKTWGYRLQSAGGAATGQEQAPVRRQLAPLLVGREPHWIRAAGADSDNTVAAAITGGIVVSAIGVLWLVAWRVGRGDQRFHREKIARKFAPAGGKSLDDLALEDHGKPDFSGL